MDADHFLMVSQRSQDTGHKDALATQTMEPNSVLPRRIVAMATVYIPYLQCGGSEKNI